MPALIHALTDPTAKVVEEAEKACPSSAASLRLRSPRPGNQQSRCRRAGQVEAMVSGDSAGRAADGLIRRAHVRFEASLRSRQSREHDLGIPETHVVQAEALNTLRGGTTNPWPACCLAADGGGDLRLFSVRDLADRPADVAQKTVPVELVEYAGRGDHAARGSTDKEPPGPEELEEEMYEPQIEATLEAVTDVVTTQNGGVGFHRRGGGSDHQRRRRFGRQPGDRPRKRGPRATSFRPGSAGRSATQRPAWNRTPPAGLLQD